VLKYYDIFECAGTSVSDLCSFDPDPDPACYTEYGTVPILIRIQGFDDQKIKKNLQRKKNCYVGTYP
jgi:hypothetical protein